jgi:hypothetical protein
MSVVVSTCGVQCVIRLFEPGTCSNNDNNNKIITCYYYNNVYNNINNLITTRFQSEDQVCISTTLRDLDKSVLTCSPIF